MSDAIDELLGGLERAPNAPEPGVCAGLLEELARMIALGGAARFLRPPVAFEAALPDPWMPTPFGVGVVLLRLFDHAGLALDVKLRDGRDEANRTDTLSLDARLLRLIGVEDGRATFEIVSGGPGAITVMEAVGAVALRALAAAAPYREDGIPMDTEWARRCTIMCVYLGLGAVIGGRTRGLADVVLLGDVELAFLLAVQAIARDDAPPDSLASGYLHDAIAWCEPLVDRADALRAALRIGAAETWGDVERAPSGPLTRRPILEDGSAPAPVRRHHMRKTTGGAIVGGVVGAIAAGAAAMPAALIGAVALGAVGVGAWIGHGVAYARCSGCGALLVETATMCTACGGALAL